MEATLDWNSGIRSAPTFGVFKVDKIQSTDEGKQFYADICKLSEAKRVNILKLFLFLHHVRVLS